MQLYLFTFKFICLIVLIILNATLQILKEYISKLRFINSKFQFKQIYIN